MSAINFQRTYLLRDAYASIKERAAQVLGRYKGYPNLVTFNDLDRSITFSTERLIPTVSTNRTRVLLLFSNPHPHSIRQGMFLSPSTKGRENLFWPVMHDAGWLPIEQGNRTPEQLVDICLHAKYAGPFELIFHCYYAFPTDYPKDLSRIFGSKYFNEFIEPDANNEFKMTIQETSAEAVVTFNKGIYNLVSEAPIERYIEYLMEGKLIQSRVKGIDRDVPIFLTYPTGWRYHRQYMQLRTANLDLIRTAICSRPRE